MGLKHQVVLYVVLYMYTFLISSIEMSKVNIFVMHFSFPRITGLLNSLTQSQSQFPQMTVSLKLTAPLWDLSPYELWSMSVFPLQISKLLLLSLLVGYCNPAIVGGLSEINTHNSVIASVIIEQKEKKGTDTNRSVHLSLSCWM